MDAREIIEVALRVLSAWSNGHEPLPGDEALLRTLARPQEADYPADELACTIIARESRRCPTTISAQSRVA